MFGNKKGGREGEIDVTGFDFLDGSIEFARFWSEPEGEQTFIIEPRALGADPFLFGMAMVDAIRHGAIAYSRAVGVSGRGSWKGSRPSSKIRPTRRSRSTIRKGS
jgi:hypothetical protein